MQTNSGFSGDCANASDRSSADTGPARPGHAAEPSGTSSTVHVARNLGHDAARASSSSRSITSCGVRFANSRDILSASSGSDAENAAIWYIGVIPVPPATMPTDAHRRARVFPVNGFSIEKAPPPLYLISPMGPATSTASPTCSESKYCVTRPFGYTFTTRSNEPLVLSSVTGVYARDTPSPPGSRTSRWLPTGSPSTAAGDSSAKVKRCVARATCSRATSL
mmetsp:Transcript_68250/g.192420  ORF Transcript_68250/g.192420 Transcript_68250/m.192420 type:complete len:222 (-) Transcript_68250:30-695(-)